MPSHVDELVVFDFIENSITSDYNEIVFWLILKSHDIWLSDKHSSVPRTTYLRFNVSECATDGKSAWEYSRWSITNFWGHFKPKILTNTNSAVNLTIILENSLSLRRIVRLVVLR